MSAVVLVALVGCSRSHDVNPPPEAGDADADGGGADAAVAVSGGLCARFAAIQCRGEMKCCSAPARTEQECLSAVAQSCAQSVYLDQIAASSITGFDDAAAESAFGEFESRVARCDIGVSSWVLSNDGLRGAFRGTRGEGESCTAAGGVAGDPGEIAAALSSCRLADGLACLPTGGLLGDWTCASKQAVGGMCLTDENCDGATCDNFSQPAVGSCVERLQLGAACTNRNAAQCESLYCESQACAEPDSDTVYCPAL